VRGKKEENKGFQVQQMVRGNTDRGDPGVPEEGLGGKQMEENNKI